MGGPPHHSGPTQPVFLNTTSCSTSLSGKRTQSLQPSVHTPSTWCDLYGQQYLHTSVGSYNVLGLPCLSPQLLLFCTASPRVHPAALVPGLAALALLLTGRRRVWLPPCAPCCSPALPPLTAWPRRDSFACRGCGCCLVPATAARPCSCSPVLRLGPVLPDAAALDCLGAAPAGVSPATCPALQLLGCPVQH